MASDSLKLGTADPTQHTHTNKKLFTFTVMSHVEGYWKHLTFICTLNSFSKFNVFAILFTEFTDLSSEAQNNLLKCNGSQGMSLIIATYENLPSGIDQIRNGFGITEAKEWEKDFLPVFKNPER